MRLLVTGASGFLGRHVVTEALARGHRVRAMVRPAGTADDLPWKTHRDVELVRADLRDPRGLVDMVAGVDAVLHLAASKAGDFDTQFRGTVNATENLLTAMAAARVKRLVAISSFSVYDYLALRTHATLDESSPLAPLDASRDAYTQTKLVQEQLVREFADEHNAAVTILRPGVIYGRANTWTARLGAQVSDNFWIRIGAWARLPLIYVDHCAEAVVLAVERDGAIGQTINLVDDAPPTQRRYMKELLRRTSQRPRIIPINWTCMRLLAATAHWTNRLLFSGRARLPGVLIPARLHARCKPLRYANERMKRVLGCTPRYNLTTALDRSVVNPVISAPTDSATTSRAHVKEASNPCASPT